MRVRSGINKGRRWIVGSSIHGCWLGHYEIEKQSVIRRLVKPGMKVFDVGAVAERPGIASFGAGASSSTGWLADGGNRDVPTVSLDRFCDQAGIGCPDLIKFDIEGGESLALKGASRVLAQGEATILLALHGREHEKNCLSLLQAGHYVLQYLDGTPARDEPLRSDEIVAFPPGASSCAG